MGNDFHLKCQFETRKIVWLVALFLASVLITQYFEPPYSLLSYSKAYFNFSNSNRHTGYNGKNESYFKNNSSPRAPKIEELSISIETPVPENAPEMEIRSISIAPKSAHENAGADHNISPSNNYRADQINRIAASPASFIFAPAPVKSGADDGFIENSTVPLESGANARIAAGPISLDLVSLAPLISPSQSASQTTADNRNNSEVSDGGRAPSDKHAPMANSHPPKGTTPDQSPVASVVSISDMNDMLAQSRLSSFSEIPLWATAADKELSDARFQIENGAIIRDHPGLYAPIYRNITTFVRSYEIMEKKLKIYIYKDGKKPVFHQPRLRGIYASEGWFMKHLETSNQFLTNNPAEAHLFYLPFSSQLLVDYVYVPESHTFHDIIEYLKNYLDTIKTKYPFWNRTDGSDHFLVACHDWAPVETRRHMAKCIRALCNADVKEGFEFGKDISLPETYVHSPQNPLQQVGGKPPSERKILAFFAGQMHGYVRPILLQHWQNKDPDMKIFGRLKGNSYTLHMKTSKYCICAKGYEVNSPRVVEAIVYGCVPVIISDNFVPPFFEILKWESFAVFVLEKDIPNLKEILMSISEKRYAVMQHRVKMVRQHFLWHNKPMKYDIFHMILHSVWFNRVFRLKPGS